MASMGDAKAHLGKTEVHLSACFELRDNPQSQLRRERYDAIQDAWTIEPTIWPSARLPSSIFVLYLVLGLREAF